MSDKERERLTIYLSGIAKIFNKNGPKITGETQVNEYTTINNTDTYLYNLTKNFVNTLNNGQVEKFFKDQSNLDDIVIILIKKISGKQDEPLWSVVNFQGKQYFIPSEGAIQKYNIQPEGQNSNFLTPEFQIPPLEPESEPAKSFFSFSFFKGGKKTKRRRYTKSKSKQRVKRRAKKSTYKKSYKK
jgi:hypothetical protein